MLQPFDFPFNKNRQKINAVKIYVESLNPRRLNIEENSFLVNENKVSGSKITFNLSFTTVG